MKRDLVNAMIEQATEYMTDVSRYSSDVKLPHLNREKLIKIIVSECANVAWDEVQYAINFETADAVKKRVLDHFGV